ncbi:phosphatidylcholine/phosphatidylserine synthase [Elizabethkingia sp. JS20170427COW]|uniref:CDP-alcohol phosphatidyltransferase family protein n=1 Tax=Elizabethkingia sp. JS20170427COW TaxID=2583851 RepID=UPI0011104153|nr:CDP-alcohol phosphatidyltransferase family protein [Elizabethkingia sp. JS20170427COW]QCX52842.1 CDP-alcohol phosphatidyltransferase [Elizabethkingia sp. JS20170427COW]
MNFIRNNFANALTLGNLFCGCVGAIELLDGNYQVTALCILGSLILDFFDGFTARALKANSNLGVQLDSLADMVSFGFLPGLTMYLALENFSNQLMGITLPFELKYLGIFVTLFSCLRLAIFNLDEDQKYYFKGLNTPSNTILLFGMYYCFQEKLGFSFLFENEVLLVFTTLLFSWMLVSPIKMIAMKFKSKQLKDNYPKLALLGGCILLLLVLGKVAIPLCILYYILVSLIFQKKLI